MHEGGDKMQFTRKNALLCERNTVPNPMRTGTFFNNMVELTWLEESNDILVSYGCLICGEQALSRPQMSIHVGTHNPANANKVSKPRGKYKTKKAKQDNAVGTVDKMIADLIAERDNYKAQARKYQKQLQALRDLFKIDEPLV
jgi:hypothetical protein